MEVPRLTTVDGAYDYFIGLLILLALLLAVLVLGVYFGVIPDPATFSPGP